MPLAGSARPGRHSIASTIRSGYSATQLKTMRRNEPGRDAPDHPTRRNPHIEGGQVPRRRPAPREFAVTHQGADNENQQWTAIKVTIDLDRDDDEHDQQPRMKIGWTSTTSQWGMSGRV